MIIMTQLNPILVGRHGPVRVMSVGVLIAASGAAALLTTALTGFGGMLGFLVPLGVILGAAGICFPNAPAIALSRHGEVAGTRPRLLGAAQFLVAGSVAPLVGALDDGSGVAMAAVIVGTTALAATLFWTARRRLLDESGPVDQDHNSLTPRSRGGAATSWSAGQLAHRRVPQFQGLPVALLRQHADGPGVQLELRAGGQVQPQPDHGQGPQRVPVAEQDRLLHLGPWTFSISRSIRSRICSGDSPPGVGPVQIRQSGSKRSRISCVVIPS
jgi:hypothetical protein